MLFVFSETLHCMFPYLRKAVKFVAYMIISLTHKVLFILRNSWPPFFGVMHKTLSLVFKLIIGLVYLKKKTTIWPYSNFIVILYKRFNNVPLSLFMELSRTMFQATSPAAAGFLTMRTSCGEYVTLSEMMNYEVIFQRSSCARSYYDGLEKMEY